jgi:hypothetical protein
VFPLIPLSLLNYYYFFHRALGLIASTLVKTAIISGVMSLMSLPYFFRRRLWFLCNQHNHNHIMVFFFFFFFFFKCRKLTLCDALLLSLVARDDCGSGLRISVVVLRWILVQLWLSIDFVTTNRNGRRHLLSVIGEFLTRFGEEEGCLVTLFFIRD